MAEIVEAPPLWMVLARHLMMPGGIIDYGVADIKKFCDSPEEADKYAEELFERTHEGLVQPTVWVLRCEKTYKEDVVIVTKGGET